MQHTSPSNRQGRMLASCVLASLLMPWSQVHADRGIDEHRPADPQGEVEIFNVSGVVEIVGWDRAEVQVTGKTGDNVERVEVISAGNRTSIHVVSRADRRWGSDDEARLTVHVPAKSTVRATLVNANLQVTGIQGDSVLQTVSGDMKGEVGGNVRADTVSGNVKLTARAATSIEVKTISGDISLSGGGGEADVSTVSGEAKIELGTLRRGRFKSVSGDLYAGLALDPDGQIEGESVSGTLRLEFAHEPAADIDVQSFSGTIDNCFGPKPTESRYGPGSHLTFKSGESHAHVRLDTKSGDVHLCYTGGPSGRSARVARSYPYVM